tara:strand:+ start:560 stop:748 length:189 start_codon:yes stop_codon:yes gene_type:complete
LDKKYIFNFGKGFFGKEVAGIRKIISYGILLPLLITIVRGIFLIGLFAQKRIYLLDVFKRKK